MRLVLCIISFSDAEAWSKATTGYLVCGGLSGLSQAGSSGLAASKAPEKAPEKNRSSVESALVIVTKRSPLSQAERPALRAAD